MKTKLCIMLGLALVGSTGAFAQDRPVLSPYLELLRNDRGLGFNYYRRFQPEQQWRRQTSQNQRSLQQLGQQTRQLQLNQAQLTRSVMGSGGVTGFLNHRGFFLNHSGGGGGGGGAARASTVSGRGVGGVSSAVGRPQSGGSRSYSPSRFSSR